MLIRMVSRSWNGVGLWLGPGDEAMMRRWGFNVVVEVGMECERWCVYIRFLSGRRRTVSRGGWDVERRIQSSSPFIHSFHHSQ